MTVTFAVILLLLGMTIRFITVFSGAHVRQPGAYAVLAVLVGIPYLIIWFIFQGKNLARWVFLVVFGLALCSLSVNLQKLFSLPVEQAIGYTVQVMLCLTAAAALLSSASANWFRGKNDT
jgi:hypothetical protein